MLLLGGSVEDFGVVFLPSTEAGALLLTGEDLLFLTTSPPDTLSFGPLLISVTALSTDNDMVLFSLFWGTSSRFLTGGLFGTTAAKLLSDSLGEPFGTYGILF